MNRRLLFRALAAALFIFTCATQQAAAYEPYSQFEEFFFGGGQGGSLSVPVPQGLMWAIENVSGRIVVPTGVQVANLIVFDASGPSGSANNVIFPSPVLTSQNVFIGTGPKDVYFFNDAARAYYSSPYQITINAASNQLDQTQSSISISLTGYLVPLSTVWTGVTSLNPGDIKEVAITDLQLAEALQSGYDYTSLPQFGGAHQVQAGGELRVAAGKRLRFTSTGTLPTVAGQNGPSTYTTANYNGGLIELSGNATNASEIEFIGSLVNASSTGLITGQSAMMRFTGGLDNYGPVAFTAGINNIHGDITNQSSGNLTVTAGAQAVFYDDVVQNGTLRVAKVGSTTSVATFLGAFTGSGGTTGGGDIFFEGDLRPGNSPAAVTFANNVGLGGDANTVIELAGTAAGQFDQINVTGGLSLDGALTVALLGGFTPAVGNSFDILNWTTLDGTFSSLTLPALSAGLAWNTSQLYTTGVLSVSAAPGVPGDYNNNGVVDAADYVLWRNGGPLANEVDTPGVVNVADYSAWRARFGNTSGSGTGAAGELPSTSGSVPEPASWLLVTVFFWLGFHSSRFRYPSVRIA